METSLIWSRMLPSVTRENKKWIEKKYTGAFENIELRVLHLHNIFPLSLSSCKRCAKVICLLKPTRPSVYRWQLPNLVWQAVHRKWINAYRFRRQIKNNINYSTFADRNLFSALRRRGEWFIWEGLLFELRHGQMANVGGRKIMLRRNVPITLFVGERSKRGRDKPTGREQSTITICHASKRYDGWIRYMV